MLLLLLSCLVTQSHWEEKFGPLDPEGQTRDSGQGHPWVEVSWGASKLEARVHNREPGVSYQYGIAETHPMCSTQAGIVEGRCWTGEDCHRGFQADSGSYQYCHPADEDLALDYADDPGLVSEGQTTLFSQNYAFLVTHILLASTGECWVWGLEPEHYEELDCERTGP